MYWEAKAEAKAYGAQVVPSPRTLVRSCLLGATVEVTGQQGEKGERRFLLRESIQTRLAEAQPPRRNSLQKIRRRPSFGGIKDKGLPRRRRRRARWAYEASPRVSAKASHAPAATRLQCSPAVRLDPSKHFWQHRMLAIDPDKMSVSILLNGRPFRRLVLRQTVKVDPVEADCECQDRQQEHDASSL